MEKITTEQVMDRTDMFQSRFGKIDKVWMLGLKNNFIRCREAIYLDRVQRIIPNSRNSFDISVSGTSVNERTGRIDTENIAYNCTLTYGT